MLTLYILAFLLIVLGITALHWGADSADGAASKEWE